MIKLYKDHNEPRLAHFLSRRANWEKLPDRTVITNFPDY